MFPWARFFLYVLVTAGTPGPNTLSSMAGGRRGTHRRHPERIPGRVLPPVRQFQNLYLLYRVHADLCPPPVPGAAGDTVSVCSATGFLRLLPEPVLGGVRLPAAGAVLPVRRCGQQGHSPADGLVRGAAISVKKQHARTVCPCVLLHSAPPKPHFTGTPLAFSPAMGYAHPVS